MKPTFTEQELTHLRSLPKKARKAEVKRLKEKYYSERRGGVK